MNFVKAKNPILKNQRFPAEWSDCNSTDEKIKLEAETQNSDF